MNKESLLLVNFCNNFLIENQNNIHFQYNRDNIKEVPKKILPLESLLKIINLNIQNNATEIKSLQIKLSNIPYGFNYYYECEFDENENCLHKDFKIVTDAAFSLCMDVERCKLDILIAKREINIYYHQFLKHIPMTKSYRLKQLEHDLIAKTKLRDEYIF